MKNKIFIGLIFLISFLLGIYEYYHSQNHSYTILGCVLTGVITWFAIFKTSELDRNARKEENLYKLYFDRLNEYYIKLENLKQVYMKFFNEKEIIISTYDTQEMIIDIKDIRDFSGKIQIFNRPINATLNLVNTNIDYLLKFLHLIQNRMIESISKQNEILVDEGKIYKPTNKKDKDTFIYYFKKHDDKNFKISINYLKKDKSFNDIILKIQENGDINKQMENIITTLYKEFDLGKK